jgi:ATP-dependent protease ClpP protease subunit
MHKHHKHPKPGPALRNRMMSEYFLEDIHTYRIDRHNFTIFVGGDPSYAVGAESTSETGVEYRMGDRFDINMSSLSALDPNRPILVLLSSCGGFMEVGMQMFSAILTCPNPVIVLATKWARSMTSIVPLAADRFLIRPPANYMIHRGEYHFSGSSDLASTDDIERRKDNELMLRLYVARLKEQGAFTEWSEQRIRKKLNDAMNNQVDVWLSPSEAKRWGFVDDIYRGDGTMLRTAKKNFERRDRMLNVLSQDINVEVRFK